MAYRMSTMRIISASTRPPIKPATAPQATPSDTDTSVASSPTVSEMRPPTSVRTSKSRPSSSVPNRCQPVRVGAMPIWFQSVSS